MDPIATNYNQAANVAGSCNYPGPFGPDDPDGPVGPFGPFFPLIPVGGLGGLIPVTGGLNDLSCVEANTLILPSGDKVTFSDPLCEFEAALTQEFSDTLLAPLPSGLTFVSGFNLELQKKATNFKVLPEPVTDTLSFVVPEDFQGKSLKILFWDAAAKGGLGEWVEIPVKLMVNGAVVTAPLSVGDNRMVMSGFEVTPLPSAETTLNFTGLFVLVTE